MVTCHIYKCAERRSTKWDKIEKQWHGRERLWAHLLPLDVQWKLSTEGTFACQAPSLTELSACSTPRAPLWLKGFISLLLASFACGATQKPRLARSLCVFKWLYVSLYFPVSVCVTFVLLFWARAHACVWKNVLALKSNIDMDGDRRRVHHHTFWTSTGI